MNGHTHAAMTLFRGFGDDLPLQTWLEDKIWPLEEKLTDEDVYWATRLACLEMIRTGTTFFNDMYWEFEAIKDAVADSGIRARISGVFIDQFDEELADQQRQMNRELADQREDLPGRIDFALGPHSIYTVSADSLEWIANFSRDQDIPVHIHLAETEWEVEDCREKHGTTPVRYLDQMNFFHDGVVAAHGLWLEDEEIQILAENDVSVIYNPMSNLKLTSGADFRYEALRDAGVQVCLGTDGVASNNNLNLFEEIKTASLLQKNRTSDPTTLPAQEAFGLATRQAADVFELNAGRIEEGRQADFMLIDTNTAETALADVHDTNSLLAYALTPDAIDTVICSGDVLMRNGEPTDSEYSKIIEKHRELTVELCE
jgi:5-methylthioadenosine/S-adenosylhomocysteine deaminase